MIITREVPNIENVETAFLGECFGVVLSKRSPEDSHVCYRFIIKDTSRWHESHAKATASSYWMEEAITLLSFAQSWLKLHYERDGHFGFKLKE